MMRLTAPGVGPFRAVETHLRVRDNLGGGLIRTPSVSEWT